MGRSIVFASGCQRSADRSYGVHVARLAGLPSVVLGRAEQVLDELESGQHGAVDAE